MKALLGAAIGSGVVLAAATAGAVPCSGRPTDPAGYQGYTYGAAEVKTFDGKQTRVHYATTGSHAPTLTTTRADLVPDSVALAGEIADTSLAKYAALGFKEPPSDGACTSNGGDAKIDIYLVAFAGADGTTVPEACTGAVCSSFLLVESTFLGRGYPTTTEGFKTVVAHELFHAVQNAYDHDMDRFWAEGSAQWAMKTVYPELTDFEGQLPAFFKDNTRSLDTQPSGVTAGFLYGAAVWPLFLTLRHGPDTVKLVLEAEAAGASSLVAVDAVAKSKGSSLGQEMPLFGAWNAATKSLAAADGYPDAAKYPGVKIDALTDGATAITSGLPYFAYRATLATPTQIVLETDAARNAGVAVPIEGGKPVLAKAQPLPSTQTGDVLVVVAGITTKKTDAPFTLHLREPEPGSSGT
ncbi:MAG TPA: MXAN_6640 family putative metalloprotease, partial [Labilithrix sp.]|nr:MXAN_6640 family putative metalloprotease [Labilithrix sp.]